MKNQFFTLLLCAPVALFSQNIAQKLDAATKNLMNTAAATSASLSFYVTDESGVQIYDYQGDKGLSSASTQKIFTAAAALETLGKDYRYTTTASYSGNIADGKLTGNMLISSNGDPTLGSWRYDGWKPENFRSKLLAAMKEKGITEIAGDLVLADTYFDFQTVPGGWPWNDMGNYYGAGVWSINWRENQFDIEMNGRKMNSLNVDLPNVKWINEVETGGSSDQSLVFTAPHSDVAYINGTLPGKSITVSGAMPNPPLTLGYEIRNWLQNAGIVLKGNVVTNSARKINGQEELSAPKSNVFFTYQSPEMEKIIYWFLRKSVNLYGETLVKTMAMEKKKNPSFDSGISYMREFWKSKGISSYMINFADGSGLSPQNYVSAKAEVKALLYANKQPWFGAFYEGFPTINNMKMKSGTMKNTKSFAGYHTSSSGKKYVYAILLNNYQGGGISEALYKVLDVLK